MTLSPRLSRRALSITCIPLILAYSGCAASFEPVPHSTKVHGNHVVSSTASLTNSYLLDKDSNLIHCSPPPPDAAFSETASGGFSLSLVSIGGGQEGAEESSAGGEAEMQGRTLSVLPARELLFRCCEFSRNNGLTPEQATALYQTNLDIIKSVSAVEAQNTTISISESLTETITDSASMSESDSKTESDTVSESDSITEAVEEDSNN